MQSQSQMLHLKHRMSEFKEGSISILLMLHDFVLFAHFTLAGIAFLIHFHGFSIFLLLKAAKNNRINKNIETYFYMIYAQYLLINLPHDSEKQSVDKHKYNKCMLMLILVCGKNKNGPGIVCVFIKKGQNGKN